MLTLHGISRCDRAAGPGAKPEVQLDVVIAGERIAQVAPAETREWSLVELAAREAAVAKAALFDHQLRFQCAPGVTSRITATLYSQKDAILSGPLSMLSFDHGKEIWEAGNNASRVVETRFAFCL